MTQPPKKSGNEPELRPIIVKKIVAGAHDAHHGGAWKVAYADFVTAMMAFFLLMWLLGATTEKQRKGLADYFTPTLVQMRMDSAGSSGLFGGDSFTAKDNYPTTGGQGNLAVTIPRDATGVRDVGGDQIRDRDRQQFEQLKRVLEERLAANPSLRRLRKQVKFTETREGLRIDLIDEADFAMFAMGTDRLFPEARDLLAQVAQVIAGMPNDVIVRGHTDSLPYASGRNMNNWLLSTTRAEATRAVLAQNAIEGARFMRIEGVADREPFVPDDRYDPRNRRMSVILAWSKSSSAKAPLDAGADTDADADTDLPGRGADRLALAKEEVRRLDLGRSALPTGAALINQDAVPKRTDGPPGKSPALVRQKQGAVDE